MSTDTTDDVRALREALKIAETTAHPELGAVTLAHVADAARIARVLDEMDRLRARVAELERDAAQPAPSVETIHSSLVRVTVTTRRPGDYVLTDTRSGERWAMQPIEDEWRWVAVPSESAPAAPTA